MENKTFIFLIVFLLSAINNLFVSTTIYYYRYGGFFKKHPPEFIGFNAWGIIMDGFLAGLINIFAVNIILEVEPQFFWSDMLISLVIAVLITTAIHTYMLLKVKNLWIMPVSNKWHAGGYWHLFSMTAQGTFLSFVVLTLLKNPSLFLQGNVSISFGLAIIFGGLFMSSVYLCTKGIRIGRFHLNREAW